MLHNWTVSVWETILIQRQVSAFMIFIINLNLEVFKVFRECPLVIDILIKKCIWAGQRCNNFFKNFVSKRNLPQLDNDNEKSKINIKIHFYDYVILSWFIMQFHLVDAFHFYSAENQLNIRFFVALTLLTEIHSYNFPHN